MATKKLLQRHRPFARKHRRPAIDFLENRTLLATFTVTNTDLSGTGSLSLAIDNANRNPGPDTINFNIPGGGVQTITPGSQLPIITGPLAIDATTQPGRTPGHPMIELDGSKMTQGNGLEFQGGGNVIKGLIVRSFPWDGIVLAEFATTVPLGRNVVQGNYLGTNAAGTEAKGNGFAGLRFVNSPHNTIGGTGSGEGNLLSGNVGDGIDFDNQRSEGNLIIGNLIGTDISGLKTLGNRHGIFFTQTDSVVGGSGYASDNTVGTPGSGAGNILERGGNIVAGNQLQGIYILKGNLNKVWNNYIGVGIDGTTPIPNGKNGVVIEDADADDAAQETLWQLYRRIGALRAVAAFPAWLMAIVRRECARLSGRKHYQPLLDDSAILDRPDLELRMDVAAAIESLPEHYRQIVVLRDLQGMTVDAICKAHDLSRETVKGRLHRARGLMREYLSK